MTDQFDQFENIRPYRDEEVRQVLTRLVRDPTLLAAVARFRLRGASQISPGLVRWLLSKYLGWQVRNIRSVREFQQFLESYMVRMIKGTTDGFTYSGIEALPRDRAFLFVSNHRDIAMDSGFMNYALWRDGRETSRIAIGDNLLMQPYATDLMRLNKSFVVRRNVSGPKDMLKAVQLTSSYLQHSIDEGSSVWIAQREGRAKDGRDRTDPALIKMFHVSQRKAPFAEVIRGLHVVPVAVSYELDPCDVLKAKELYLTERDGSYAKPQDEDLWSIVTGITGGKGRVHLHFGEELVDPPDSPEAVATLIDEQILAGYRIWPTNRWSAEQLDEAPAASANAADDARASSVLQLQERLAQCPPEHRPFVIQQYANPLLAR